MNLRNYIIIILLIVGAFSIFTLNSSHPWGDDFAMYLIHAENIATGKPYTETGFIYNELAPTYAPQSYPPGFPLLLAIVQPLFGLDFLAYKIYILFFFLFFLWLVFVWLKDKLDVKYIVGIIILLGFAPFIWQLRDSVLSDMPAATFTLAAIVIYEKAMKSKKWLHFILLAFLIYFTYSIRTIGIVLLPAIFLDAVFNRTQKYLRVFIILPFFLLFIWAQSKLFQQDDSYFGILINIYSQLSLHEVFQMLIVAIKNYFNAFSDFFIGSYHNILTNSIVFYMGMVLFLIGFLWKTFKAVGLIEFLFLGSLLIILFWPSYQGLRFFIPLLPMYLYYIVCGINMFKSNKIRNIIAGAYIFLALASFISFYTNVNFNGDQYGVTDKASSNLLQFIHDSIDDTAIIMAAKPRAICLFTNKKAIVYPDTVNSNLLWKNIATNKVDYLLLSAFNSYPPYLNTEIATTYENLQIVFENEEWILYQINKDTQ